MPRPRIWPMGPPLLSVGQRDGNRQSRLIADHARRVAFAREVFGQSHVTGTVAMHGAVAQADLDFAGQGDDELPARRVVPVGEVAGLRRAEHDALGRLHGRQLRVRGEIQLVDVGLAVFPGIEPNHVHARVSSYETRRIYGTRRTSLPKKSRPVMTS